MPDSNGTSRRTPRKRQKKSGLPFGANFMHQDTPEETWAKNAAAASSAEAVMDAFNRMNETTTASFKASEELPSLQESKPQSNMGLSGLYGTAFLNAKPSSELLEKEQERQKREHEGEDYEARLSVLEQGLCEKFGIVPPVKRPNRRQDRGESGEEILVLGQTVNDRKHPKLWGIRQEDRTRHTYLIGGTGSGKLICDYEPVLTADGWRKMGDIKVGDQVYNRYGILTTVTHLHKEKHQQVWEIEFADGTVIDTYATHPWIIERNIHKGYRELVKTTEEMLNDGIYDGHKSEPGTSGRGYRNHVILCEPVAFPEQELSIPPYALGAILGDGCLVSGHGVNFSTKDIEILDNIIESLGGGYSYKKQCKNNDKDYGWSIRELNNKGKMGQAAKLHDKFAALGLVQRSEDKFIPEQYLFASIEQRRELLKGLMDTDGSASKGRISFCTISERLRDGMLSLVRSLGYEAHISLDYREDKYERTNGKCWRINIFSNDVDNIFKLTRKREELKEYRKGRSQSVKTYDSEEIVYYENETASEDFPAKPLLYGMLIGRTHRDAIRLNTLTDAERKLLKTAYPDIEFKDNENSTGKHVLLRIDGLEKGNRRPSNALRTEMDATSWNSPIQTRRVDDVYMHMSYDDRIDFLKGFIAQHMHAHGRHMEYANRNKALLDDIASIFTSCGYVIEFVPIQKNTSWQMFWRNPDKKLIVRDDDMKILMRNNAFDTSGQRQNHNKSMAIVDIRITDRYEDMTCLTVAEGESYLLKNFIVTHNSTLLHAIGVEDMWYYRGGLIIEPHGDLCVQLLKSAPPYRIHDIIYLNVLDTIASPGFNPLELPPNPTDDDRQEVVGAVTSLIAKHFNMDTGYVKLLKMLTNALNAMSYVPGITLLELMDFYSNEDIRESILSFVPDGPQKDNMRDLAQNAKPDDLASLDNRISRFTTNRYMRHLFGQSNTTVDLYDLMNQGAYIISPIPKGATKDDVFIKFYGSYIVSEVYKAAVMREAIPEGDRVNFALTLDECQNFLGGSGSGSADAEGILSEARKYGLQMMLANQYLAQLSNDLKAAIMQNCATKMCYAMQSTDATEMAKAMGVSAQDLMSIPKYHVMASPLVRGGNVTPFISAVFPPISLKSDVSDITAELIAENSRNKYMKKRDEIEDEIADRRERLVSGNKEAIMALVKKKNK